jgi:hypothetical protein
MKGRYEILMFLGLTVDGNLTFTGKSVISVSDGVTTISASNCINLNDVVLNSTGKPSTIRLQSTSTASCWIVGNITTSDGRCARATIVGRNILEITFPCENGTGSQTLLIVAVSVVAVLIVLGTIIAVAYYFVRKYTVDAEFKKIHTPPSQRADE